MTPTQLVKVKEHIARRAPHHYGFQVFQECYTDSELDEELVSFTTFPTRIKHLYWIAESIRERYEDIAAEAF